MKNIIYIFLLATIFSFQSQAQSYDPSDRLVNIGIGLGATLYGSGYNTVIPPLSVSYEQGFDFSEAVTLGGYLGFSSSKRVYISNSIGLEYGYKYTSIIIGARGSYHFLTTDVFDPYVGAMIGYNIVSSSDIGVIPNGTVSSVNSSIGYSFYVGSRYYFKDSMSAFAELGYGISYLTIGISMKI